MGLKLLSTFSLLLSSFQSVSYAQKPQLLIAAASDLMNLQEPLRKAFPEADLTFSFGSSGMLARQIENGAPFDVFLSANEAFMMDLVRKGKVDKESVMIYATGRIALWSKSGNVQSLDDLRKLDGPRVSIANPEHAPYGLAARQALEKTGLWANLERSVVLAENVRQALKRVPCNEFP